jgi:class 3 adenylate cyclase
VLDAHRREIAVCACALAGFASFAERAEPEDVIAVLNGYHDALGGLVDASAGALVRLAGDELMVVFNDPAPCAEPAGAAVRLALALRDRVWELAEGWTRLGFDLQLAAGIALGHATVGRIGSEHRWEYAPVGTVPTLAERLCESAAPGQILVSRRVHASTEPFAVTQLAGELSLRGFADPTPAWDVLGLET